MLNVTTVHNVNPDGLVFINVSWRAPENPYGTEEFKIFIFEANLEKNLVLLSGDTKVCNIKMELIVQYLYGYYGKSLEYTCIITPYHSGNQVLS